MAVYANIYYEIYINSVWEDLTPDIIDSQSCSYGINGVSETDRISSTGQLTFTLRNDAGCIGGIAGYYSPYKSGAKSGWRIGIPFRLRVNYDSANFIRFYGYIGEIKPTSGSFGTRNVEVTVLDWIEYAAKQNILLPGLLENKRIDEITEELLTLITPGVQNTELYTGQDTFSYVFDTVKSNTKILSEFNKLALSELGYIYLKHDKDYGETIVVEGRHKRTFENDLPQVPVSLSLSDVLYTEANEEFLLQDGSDLALNQLDDLVFDNNMKNLVVAVGNDLANSITVHAYPRKIDTSTQVLYKVETVLFIDAGETQTFTGYYKDPNQEAQEIGGKDMISPVANTDYKFWQNSDGTGTDLTANLSVTANYGATSVQLIVENTGGTPGYIVNPYLQCRGKGIYTYNQTDSIQEDITSQNVYGFSDLVIDQKYQDIPYVSDSVAQVLLAQNKDPRETAQTVTFLANVNDTLMRGFLYCDIGSMVYIRENQTGIDAYYYIQGIDFTINPGGLISYTWTLKEKLSLNVVYWLLGDSGYSELGNTTILGY